ncbi:uncharacterized protein LOC144769112 [Lissotriton helveticus]
MAPKKGGHKRKGTDPELAQIMKLLLRKLSKDTPDSGSGSEDKQPEPVVERPLREGVAPRAAFPPLRKKGGTPKSNRAEKARKRGQTRVVEEQDVGSAGPVLCPTPMSPEVVVVPTSVTGAPQSIVPPDPVGALLTEIRSTLQTLAPGGGAPVPPPPQPMAAGAGVQDPVESLLASVATLVGQLSSASKGVDPASAGATAPWAPQQAIDQGALQTIQKQLAQVAELRKATPSGASGPLSQAATQTAGSVGVLLEKRQELAIPLVFYMNKIVKAHATQGNLVWLNYDRDFRWAKEQNPGIGWDQVEVNACFPFSLFVPPISHAVPLSFFLPLLHSTCLIFCSPFEVLTPLSFISCSRALSPSFPPCDAHTLPSLAGPSLRRQFSAQECLGCPVPYPTPAQSFYPPHASTALRPLRPVSKSQTRVTATLENKAQWEKFLAVGTEMILTKGGRRMFPEFSVSVCGLDPNATYVLSVEAVPTDDHRYKWHSGGWQRNGKGEAHLPARLYIHPEAPATGQHWMAGPVSFSKLKVTNNMLDQGGHLILHSMHRYTLCLCLVCTSESGGCLGAAAVCFNFPETSFIAVTSYQNEKLSQLKIEENPFAKGIKEFKSHRDSRDDAKIGESGKKRLEGKQEVSEEITSAGSKRQKSNPRSPSPIYQLRAPENEQRLPLIKLRRLNDGLSLPGNMQVPTSENALTQLEDDQLLSEKGLRTHIDELSSTEDELHLPEDEMTVPRNKLIPPEVAATERRGQGDTSDKVIPEIADARVERRHLVTGKSRGDETCIPQAPPHNPQPCSPSTEKNLSSPVPSPGLSSPYYLKVHQSQHQKCMDSCCYSFPVHQHRSALIGDLMAFTPFIGHPGSPSCQMAYPYVSHPHALWSCSPFQALDNSIPSQQLYPSLFAGGLTMAMQPSSGHREVQELFQKYSQQLFYTPSSPYAMQDLGASTEMR